MKHVAFIGKAGAGKTEAAEFAVNLGYSRFSFAAPLKLIASQLWGDEFDRVRLQELGVAVRGIDEDAWVNLAIKNIEQAEGPVVIDDCRFPNEYFALRALDFEFFRISAPELSRVNRLQANGKWGGHESLNHISETALDNYACRRIDNDGDLLDFYEKVGHALEVVNR